MDQYTRQQTSPDKQGAITKAIEMSKQLNYACVVFSRDIYYIEADAPFVRNWESLIGQWQNGKKVR